MNSIIKTHKIKTLILDVEELLKENDIDPAEYAVRSLSNTRNEACRTKHGAIVIELFELNPGVR